MGCMCCIFFDVFIPGQQIMLLSASIFVEPVCPKCSASTTCLFISSWITILSPVENKSIRLVILLRTEEISSGALSFWLLRTHIFRCSSFRPADVLFVRVFTSIMKLNFFRFSAASALFVFGLSITWLIWIYCVVFSTISQSLRSTIGKFNEDFATSLSSVLDTGSGSIVFCSGVFGFSLLELGLGSLNSE